MKNETILEVIKVISEQTETNDHTSALVIASKLADDLQGNGESTRTKVLKHVREIHHLKGHMPSGLLTIREEYRPTINTLLKDLLSPETFEAFKSAM